ncbi:sulfotransferase domain-containing protein [Candidatus Neomarinimicrobiota bacterium]
MLPNFIIVGPPKAGTTSLWRYCSEHPDIFMCPTKEPQYFSYNPRNLTFEQYKALFIGHNDEKAIGEASVYYLWYQDSPKKIKACIPNCKIVIMLRNPVDRLYSAYLHRKRVGISTESFKMYIENPKIEKKRNLMYENQTVNKFKSYYEGIKNYTDLFGRENLFIGMYDDFHSKPKEFIKSLYNFLGVDDSFLPDLSRKYNISYTPAFSKMPFALRSIALFFKPLLTKIFSYDRLISAKDFLLKLNIKKKPRAITDSERKLVIELYKHDIEKLQNYLDINLEHWLR